MSDRKIERKYELVVIYDKAFEGFYLELGKDMKGCGAEICETKFLGLKNFPEKINGHDTGFYAVIKFKCESRTFRRLSKYLVDKKEILKHFITLS